MNYKKLYEKTLSSNSSASQIEQCLLEIVKLVITDDIHFQFLLQKIPWFSHPFVNHLLILQKILRIYQGRNRKFEKMGYQMLLQGLFQYEELQCIQNIIVNLAKQKYNQSVFVETLKENYPHKVRPSEDHRRYLTILFKVYQQIRQCRISIVQIILQNLIQMETECNLLDESSKGQQSDEYVRKLDENLCKFADFMDENIKQTQDFKGMLFGFEKKILMVENTQNLSLLYFMVADKNKQWAKIFAAFLLGDTFEKFRDKRHPNIFRIVVGLLTSFLCCSTYISDKVKMSVCESIKKEVYVALEQQKANNDRGGRWREQNPNFVRVGALVEAIFRISNCMRNKNDKMKDNMRYILQSSGIDWQLLPFIKDPTNKFLNCEEYFRKTPLIALSNKIKPFLQKNKETEQKQQVKVELKIELEFCPESLPCKKVKKQMEQI